MRRNFIFLFFLCPLLSVKGQQKAFPDSLAQFSYLVFGSTVLNKNFPASRVAGKQATGFFIKDNGKLYFVTALHAVKNVMNKGNRKNNFPESYNVYSHYSDSFQFISIPPVWVNDTSERHEGLKDADVFTYDVTDKAKEFPVRAVTLTDSFQVKSGGQYSAISFFGFPENMNQFEEGKIKITPPYLYNTTSFTISQNFFNQIGNDRGIDSLRYEIQIKDHRVSAAMGGFSGAPVFIYDVSKKEWQFMGVLVAINAIRNSIYVTKSEAVFNRWQ